MLQLPSLDPAIPLRLEPLASRQRCARLAQAVLDAGLVREQHVPARFTGDYRHVAQAALRGWLNEQFAGLQCLAPKFTMVVGQLELDDTFGEQRGSKDGAVIEWFGYGGLFEVGPGLERLERGHPRLGMTVLTAIEEAAWRVMPIYTPLMVMEAASDTYWCGEDDEDEAVRMSCASEEDERDMRENMVTRAMIEKVYPPWALGYRKRRRNIGKRALNALRESVRDPGTRAAIDGVIKLRALLPHLQVPDWSFREGRFIGFAGLMTWGRGDDISQRVVDDYQSMIGESGDYFEDCGRQFVPLDDPQVLARWIASMQPWCEALRLIDGLLHTLIGGSSKHD
jgi:PRTRC genetic system protein F